MDPIYFAKESINRVSFLREDAQFILESTQFQNTKVLLINNGAPAGYFVEGSPTLVRLNVQDSFILQDLLVKWGKENQLKSKKLAEFPSVVFLGLLDEPDSLFSYKAYSGTPYYIIDITNLDLEVKHEYLDSRGKFFKLSNSDASLFSYGKMFIDWLNKYNFCPTCGTATIKINGGTKLYCPNEKKKENGKFVCGSKNGAVSNIQFPRTDPVCIIAVVNAKHNKILLANHKRSPIENMYTCVAGFMEPGETIEDCCKREVWEETGVKCHNVTINSSQPWPYPVNLMIGCIGFVEFNNENEIINLGHDPELNDAKWFDIDQLKSSIETKSGDIVIPPTTAIANRLIDWVIQNKAKL